MENKSNDMKNLVFAVVISAVAILGIEYMFPSKPVAEKTVSNVTSAKTSAKTKEPISANITSSDVISSSLKVKNEIIETEINADEVSLRIPVRTPNLIGSIRLIGGRIDDLKLVRYTKNVDDKSLVTLLSPENSTNPYFVDLGYTSKIKGSDIPNDKTLWQASDASLEQGKPLTLTYTNKQGVKFTRVFVIDDGYMITISDKVENNSGNSITLFPYGLISRTKPDDISKASGHEGIVAYLDSKLEEIKYDEIIKKEQISFSSDGGWIGFGDKYWLTTLIFDQKSKETTVSSLHHKSGDTDFYQADFMLSPQEIINGQTTSFKTMVFAGAKEISLLDKYTETLGVPRFDLAIDFGWYYFLTKPFLYILKFFYNFFGNMGLSILICAFLLRLAMFPIASKSFENMSKMKKLHPMINEVNEKHKGDQVRINQEIMAIYKKENVNPAAGCLPMFIQIPIFFSLYKVLYIAIEMRQAPFYGWVHDLSVKDPTSVLTLFGLINWNVPDILNIGIWPLIMGLTMFIQQKLNPAPTDKTQAKVFMLLPILFTFMLSNFAAGLVIYWAWSNILSIIQQKLIYLKMERKNGHNKTPANS